MSNGTMRLIGGGCVRPEPAGRAAGAGALVGAPLIQGGACGGWTGM